MSKKQSLISRRQMLKTTGAAVLGLGAFNILGSRAATPSASRRAPRLARNESQDDMEREMEAVR